MENLFQWINSVLKFVGPLSDFFWDVPTMFHAYKSLPILGSFSLAIVLLMGSGIYFTLRLGFIQVKGLPRAIRLMAHNKADMGISPVAAFMLSSAMRVGPGNILGVTGAISVGGPGAIFWMWLEVKLNEEVSQGQDQKLHQLMLVLPTIVELKALMVIVVGQFQVQLLILLLLFLVFL